MSNLKEQKYCRFERTIQTLQHNEDGVLVVVSEEVCSSVNKAKRKSRELQLAEAGRLGAGVLRVSHLPRKNSRVVVRVDPEVLMNKKQREAVNVAHKVRKTLLRTGVIHALTTEPSVERVHRSKKMKLKGGRS